MVSPGAISSSPVETTATLGFFQTQTWVSPTAARVPVSRKPSRSPRRSTTSPAPKSDPARETPPPGTIGFRTRIRSPSGWVFSIITTPSAPRGSTPPVEIGVAVPGRSCSSGITPQARISRFSLRLKGSVSSAPKVSSARTA